MMARVEDQLGPYHLVRCLARGGMGDVWEAVHHGRRGAAVALKVIRGEAASCAREALREAGIGLRLDHPNVARTFDIGFTNGRAYVVLELLRGATLAELCALPGEPVPVGWAAGVALQALAGLDHAHTARGDDGRSLRLVHRDIKGSNLFLTADGTIKLLDFGIASIVAAPRQEESAHTGTLAYMAPERIAGQPGDRRSDLYALGLVLAELLSGTPAFDGLDDGSARAAIARGDIAPLRALPAGVPDGIRRWLDMALRPDARERFDSAADMGRALRACVADIWRGPRLAEWCAGRLPAGPRATPPATRRLARGDPRVAAVALESSPIRAAGMSRRSVSRDFPHDGDLRSPRAAVPSRAHPQPVPMADAAWGSLRRHSGVGPARDATTREVAWLHARWRSWTTAALALALLVAGWSAPAERPPPQARFRAERAQAQAQAPRYVAASRPKGWTTVPSQPARTRARVRGK